jgi:hypothetical protein
MNKLTEKVAMDWRKPEVGAQFCSFRIQSVKFLNSYHLCLTDGGKKIDDTQ